MNFLSFYNLITIEESNKHKANYYLKRRGLEEHVRVANALLSHSNGQISYAEVATVFRYDKRIRRILYKYIGYIEEMIRAFISNHYPNIEALPSKCREKISSEAFNRSVNRSSTFEVISYDLFFNLMKMALSLNSKQKKVLFPCLKNKNEQNFDALNRLRDQIGHNKLLVNNSDLFDVTLNKEITGSVLNRNILNLLNFLPKDLHKKFICEINSAYLDKGNSNQNQVNWILPQFLMIKIEDQ